MKRYTVLIPMTGYLSVEVEAENTDEARSTAWTICNVKEHLEDYEVHHEITEKDVPYLTLNRIEVIED